MLMLGNLRTIIVKALAVERKAAQNKNYSVKTPQITN